MKILLKKKKKKKKAGQPCSFKYLLKTKSNGGEGPILSLSLIIIIIITLFQEDTIFDTNASLTYGPQIQTYNGLTVY